MKLEWAFLAEGFGRDSRQAITVIGINQNVQIADSLPAITKRGVFAHITDEEGLLKENDTVSLSLEVRSPEGRVISAQTGEASVAPVPWPDIPLGIDVVAEIVMRLHEFGRYSITVRLAHVDADGKTETVDGAISFHVRQPIPTGPPVAIS